MKYKGITRGQIRSLLKIQNGRCAITGKKLKPVDSAVDHIIPISRKKFKNKKGYGKFWLVAQEVNKIKGSFTLEELYEIIDQIKKHKLITNKLKNKLFNEKLKNMDREEFNEYIKRNYTKDGVVKK